MNKKVIISCLAISLLAFGGIAQAGISWEGYNTTVGSFAGNGYTKEQTKYNDSHGTLSSYTVGGGYSVSARMGKKDGSIFGPHEVISSGTYLPQLKNNLANPMDGGDIVRVQFKNGFATPVYVQVTGKWASN